MDFSFACTYARVSLEINVASLYKMKKQSSAESTASIARNKLVGSDPWAVLIYFF